jgi:MFS family permease
MRFGPRAVLVPGLGLGTAGLAVFTQAPVHASYAADLLPSMVLVGVGAGLSFPALMMLAMSGADPSDAGLASGLVNTTQQVGGALGLAVLATLSSAHTATLVRHGTPSKIALTNGYQLAWTIGAGLLIAAVTVALTVLRPAAAPVASADGAQQLDELTADPAYAEAA